MDVSPKRLIFFTILLFLCGLLYSNNEKIGDSLFRNQNYKSAIVTYGLELEDCKIADDSLRIYYKICYSHYYNKNYDSLNVLLSKIDTSLVKRFKIIHYYLLAELNYRKGFYEISRTNYLNSIKLCYKFNVRDSSLADSYFGLSNTEWINYDYRKAALYNFIALKYYKKNNSSISNYINVLIAIYSYYDSNKQYKKANLIIKILEKIRHNYKLSQLYNYKINRTLGIHWVYKENYALALGYLIKAYENTDNKTSIDDNIELNRFLGYVYYRLGDYISSVKYYNNLSEILIKENKNPSYVAETQSYIISNKIILNDTSALRNIELLNRYNLKSQRFSDSYITEKQARIIQMFDTSLSIQLYNKAIELNKANVGNNNTIYTNLAILYSKRDKEICIKYLKKSFATLVKNKNNKLINYINYYNNSARVNYNIKLFSNALEDVQLSIKYNCKNFKSTALNENPDYETAFDYISLISSLRLKSKIYTELYHETKDISNLIYSLDALNHAIKYSEYLLNTHNSEDSKLYVLSNYNMLFSTAINQAAILYNKTGDNNYLIHSFKLSDKNKVTVLNKQINNNQLAKNSKIPKELIEKERGLTKKISFLKNKIYALEKDNNKTSLYLLKDKLFEFEKNRQFIIDKIKKTCPEYNEEIKLDIKSLQNNLSTNQAIIEYSLTDTVLYSFLITKKDLKLHSHKIDSSFYKNITSYKNFIIDAKFDGQIKNTFDLFFESSSYLYKVLIHPFDSIIQNRSLIIVPDKNLSFIPFESLIINNPKLDSEPKYLFFRNPISYSYSSYSILFNFQNDNSNFAGFFPKYEYKESKNYPALAPLFNSSNESITLFHEFECDTFTENNAAEKMFKKHGNKYGILHLSMHSIIDLKKPEFSKLCFTNNNDSIYDGLININELSSINLNANHVVLSGCNTGNGKLENGEGVMSFSRAFLENGTSSILMSLWKADEISSYEITKKYYNYLSQGLNKDYALQKAKIDFYKTSNMYYRHPFFWSGLSIIGDCSPINIKTKSNYYFYYIIATALFLLIIILRVVFVKNCYLRLILYRIISRL